MTHWRTLAASAAALVLLSAVFVVPSTPVSAQDDVPHPDRFALPWGFALAWLVPAGLGIGS